MICQARNLIVESRELIKKCDQLIKQPVWISSTVFTIDSYWRLCEGLNRLAE